MGAQGRRCCERSSASHPDLAVAHESRFITSTLSAAGRYGAAPAFDVEAFCRDVLEGPKTFSRVSSWPVDARSLHAAVVAAQPTDVPGAVRALYRAYAAAYGKPRYGDKTPRYVNDVSRIGATFPEARFVHIVRDGRDVALAWRDVPFGARGTMEAARLWRLKVRRARRDGVSLGPERYLEVRYEDLVADPEPVVRRICEFLELRFEPVLLDYEARLEDAFDELDEQDHHASLRMPITTGLREWRRQMKPTEIRRFEAVAGDELRDLGYELLGAGPAAVLYRAVSQASYVVGRARAKAARRAEVRP